MTKSKYKMIYILAFFVFIMSACTVRKSYTLRQRDEWKIDVTRTKDSIFIKTMTDKSCYVDTFYKGTNGYYAVWNKKLLFATVDTTVYDTGSFMIRPVNPIYKIGKVTDSRYDPILEQYPDGLYKTEIVSYKNEPKVAELAPKLIAIYYYDSDYNIVGIMAPYGVVFTKRK